MPASAAATLSDAVTWSGRPSGSATSLLGRGKLTSKAGVAGSRRSRAFDDGLDTRTGVGARQRSASLGEDIDGEDIDGEDIDGEDIDGEDIDGENVGDALPQGGAWLGNDRVRSASASPK